MNATLKFIAILFCMGNTFLIQAQNENMNWDFSSFNKLTFSYKQTMTNKSQLNLYDTEPLETYTEISGLLIVEVKDKNKADVTLKNAKITTFVKDSLGNRLDTRSQVISDLVYLKDLKENGSVAGSYNKETELFAKILFPIINNTSAGGCIIQIPLNASFDIEGVLVELKGKNIINFTSNNEGSYKLNTHIYAKKDQIEIVEGTKHICKIEGDSSYDFSTKEKYFTNGKINLNMLLKQKKDKHNTINTLVDIDVDITLNLIKVD